MLWLHEKSRDAALVATATPQGMVDYKFYCFDGEPKFLYVSQGLEDHRTAHISFLTLEWEFAPFGRSDYASFPMLPPKPTCFGEMTRVAQELSSGIPFVRVDLYERDDQPLFSEMTLSPCAGFMHFAPEAWDEKLGKLVEF